MSFHRTMRLLPRVMLIALLSRPLNSTAFQSGQRVAPRTYDLLHVKLDLNFDDDKKSVTGTTSLTFVPLSDSSNLFAFDAVNMRINGVKLSADEPIPFTYDSTQLIVKLDRLTSPLDTITIRISYSCQPKRGLYFIASDSHYPKKPRQIWSQGQAMDNRYWFPCYDFPDDKATSEMIATVRSSYSVISNGRIVDVRNHEESHTKTVHYLQSKPHSTYLISIIAGEYVTLKEMADSIPLFYNIYPDQVSDAHRSFQHTGDMLRFFSRQIGVPYPWDKYDQTVIADFMFGGMENTSATTLTDNTIHDNRAHLDISSDNLIAHELAHQWWGDLLTCRDWPNAWLNEGFANYFTGAYTEYRLGIAEAAYSFFSAGKCNAKNNDRQRYKNIMVYDKRIASTEFPDGLAYFKGGLVLRMLRHILGDSVFWKGINHYAKKFSYQTVSTEEFVQAINESVGRDLNWFFDQWLYKKGFPEFHVEARWDKEKRVLALSVKQMQTLSDSVPVFKTPVDLLIVTSKEKRHQVIEISKASEEFSFSFPEKPLMVRFDEGSWLLCTVEQARTKQELLYQLLNDEDPCGRIEVLDDLVEYVDDKDVIHAMKKTLSEDPFWGVRAEILGKLVLVGKNGKNLFSILTDGYKDIDSRVRRAAVQAMGKIRTDATARFLRDVYQRDSSYYVAAVSLTSIAQVDSIRGFDFLLNALNGYSYQYVVQTAAIAQLPHLNDDRAIPVLLQKTRPGEPVQIRNASTLGLATFALNGKQRQIILETILNLLDDSSPSVRNSAITALKRINDGGAVEKLRDVVKREPLEFIQRNARETLKILELPNRKK